MLSDALRELIQQLIGAPYGSLVWAVLAAVFTWYMKNYMDREAWEELRVRREADPRV